MPAGAARAAAGHAEAGVGAVPAVLGAGGAQQPLRRRRRKVMASGPRPGAAAGTE